MAIMYGWTYADFNTAIGWDKGVEATYLLWENSWSRKIDAYIFTDTGTSPRLTDADEKAAVGDIVNEMMLLTNLYLKGESVENPMETGFYISPGFPTFYGDPAANEGKGTEHYAILNKYKRKYSQSEVRVDSIRIGVNPDDSPFRSGRIYF